ncbi:MAG TPA: SGNH hydrolase domain-containing protein, partial [Acidimicrobiia bacterium]|nr:SGNH hydrolase domain-containing protein [Acidimicrobiia bacterium]
ISNRFTGRTSTACQQFKAETLAAIDRLHPVAVIVGNYSGYHGRILGADGGGLDRAHELRAWETGYATIAQKLRARNARMIVVLDDPSLAYDPIECIARHHAVGPCTPSRRDALKTTGPMNAAATQGVQSAGYGSLFDPTDAICDQQVCRLQDQGVYVYADPDHLTYRFTLMQTSHWVDSIAAATR